eukprot:2632389-Amphidinium_carterae.1
MARTGEARLVEHCVSGSGIAWGDLPENSRMRSGAGDSERATDTRRAGGEAASGNGVLRNWRWCGDG